MKLRKLLSAALAGAMLIAFVPAFAADSTGAAGATGATGAAGAADSSGADLFYKEYDMTGIEPDGENGVTLTEEVPDGDYSVTVTTGGDTETSANIYINGGERVRAYTLAAGETQDNVQPVVPKDGTITVNVLGDNPNVTKIIIEQLSNRTEPGEKPTIYIAGDSTAQTYDYTSVYPQTGWGQVFDEFFTDDVIIENRSMGGRSSKRFDNDGRLDKILTELKPGDYVFIQFGINDGSVNKPERYISVEDYKTLLTDKYIGETVKRGGIPVLMTPTSAAWWDEENNCFMESRADYADPTRELAKDTGVKFIDANRLITDTWNSMDKDEVLSGYFICEPLESKAYPTGTDDHTHLKASGARKIASIIADAIPDAVPELSEYLKPAASFTDISGHWAEDYINELSKAMIAEDDGSGKFRPDDSVTRAEFLKLIMDFTDTVGHAYREGECLDAAEDDWYCYYLQGALDKNLIPERMIENRKSERVTKTLSEAAEEEEAVTEDVTVYTGRFNGDTPITRAEAAAILMKCAEIKNGEDKTAVTPADKVFTDVSGTEYAGYIMSAYDAGYFSGMGDGTFAPDEALTRAQAAAILMR